MTSSPGRTPHRALPPGAVSLVALVLAALGFSLFVLRTGRQGAGGSAPHTDSGPLHVVFEAANFGTALAYLAIAWLMWRGLRSSAGIRSNALGYTAMGIFLTCGAGHLAHVLLAHLGNTRLSGPLAAVQVSADVAAFGVAVAFFALRERYGLLTGGEAALIDMRDRLAERQRAEQALRESEERYRATFDQAAIGICHVGLDGRWLCVNPALCRITGYERDELLGRTYQEITHPDDVALDEEQLARLRVGDIATYAVEKRYQRADRSHVWVNITVSPVRGEGGVIAYFIGVVEDITERKTIEIERLQLLERETALREEAERTARTKDEFLSVISHELRTPLTPILAFASLLQRNRLDDARRSEALQTIERSARSQARLIEDLLDVSRMVSGKLALEMSLVSLSHVVQDAVTAAQPSFDAHGVNLVTDIEPDVYVTGDAERLRQVVANLLSNAVKFTPEAGRVELALGTEGTCVRLTVRDTGAGIAPEFLPLVFERFRQADSSHQRAHGGLGLGLAIVRHLVEDHGGRVAVASDGCGTGATFTVTLPMRVPEPAAASAFTGGAVTGRLAGVHVLVVDDEPDTRAAIEAILLSDGATARAVSSAEEALRALRDGPPDVLLSDISMPGEDGYTLIRRVRALLPAEGGTIPAVALTAHAGSDHGDQAIASGYHLHIAKPVQPDRLIDAVAALTSRRKAA